MLNCIRQVLTFTRTWHYINHLLTNSCSAWQIATREEITYFSFDSFRPCSDCSTLSPFLCCPVTVVAAPSASQWRLAIVRRTVDWVAPHQAAQRHRPHSAAHPRYYHTRAIASCCLRVTQASRCPECSVRTTPDVSAKWSDADWRCRCWRTTPDRGSRAFCRRSSVCRWLRRRRRTAETWCRRRRWRRRTADAVDVCADAIAKWEPRWSQSAPESLWPLQCTFAN